LERPKKATSGFISGPRFEIGTLLYETLIISFQSAFSSHRN
jgi:hypothetical protein